MMNVFEKLYKELERKYGAPKGQWKLWCKRPKTEREREEVLIGAILTQRTNWKNVELALNNLKKAKINSLKDIYQLGAKKLAFLIKPSGFYKTKAQYLFNLSKFIIKNYGSLERMKKAELNPVRGQWGVVEAQREQTSNGVKELREKLLKLKGIGPETADSILLYALDKPIFVMDEYTRRLVKERNLADPVRNEISNGADKTNYQFLQKLFEGNLRKDFRLYQDFHALIVINAKN